MDTVAVVAPTSRQCKRAEIKSLFSLAHRIGYLPLNPGAAVGLPPVQDSPAERSITARTRIGCSIVNPTHAMRRC
jgi:hypothetical protein